MLQVAKALMEAFAEMIFVHGFLHGDPHPGNILVSPEGRKGFTLGMSSNIILSGKVCLLDYYYFLLYLINSLIYVILLSFFKRTVLLDHGLYRELDERFRLDYCQLWKALILLDTQKIQCLGERFGVGKYAKYFPVIFTGRTIDR